jgi:glycosyltransferase involved in cell wall biosynthesis
MRGRPSVLQVLQPEEGGVPEHVRTLALGLHERGFDVEVAASPASAPLAALEAAGFPVHRLPLERAPGRGDFPAARALRGLDARGRYDVVHAHSSKAGALTRIALPRRRRLVYTPHCFAFAARFAPVQRALYWAAEQGLVTRCAAVIAVSEWERRLAVRALAGARRVLRKIENGVGPCPRSTPDRALRDFAAGRPLAGLVSALRPQKDPLLAVRAMALLARDGAPAGRLAIVGNGELASEVRAEIGRLAVGDYVRWFPFEGPVAQYLAALDVFVLPSAWESFPLSVLEAMRCERAVLATSVGGIPEAVQDGVTGRLTPPGDAHALAEALVELFVDVQRREELAAAARDVAETRFDADRMIDETAALYRTLVAG